MSNMDKIRQEIERLKKCSKSSKKEWIDEGYNQNAFAEDCRIKSFDKLLAFIDSLPDETCKDSLQVKEICKENPDSFTGDLNNELENYYGRVPDDDDKINAARHFAEWGASQIPMPEDTVIFTKGVKEGRRLEKDDLALTWQDMKNLDYLLHDVDFENGRAAFLGEEIPFDGDEGFYGEVLKRFNAKRNEKEI